VKALSVDDEQTDFDFTARRTAGIQFPGGFMLQFIRQARRQIAGIGALSLMIGTLAACGGGSSSSPPPPPPAPTLQTVTVTAASSSIVVGSTTTLSVSAKNSDGSTASTSGVTYASDNTAVATVDASGTVTGVATGTANLTATIGSVKSAAVAITVVYPSYAIIDPSTTAPTLTAFGNEAAVVTSTGVPSGGPSGAVVKLSNPAANGACYPGTTLSTGFLNSIAQVPINTAPSQITVNFYTPVASVDVKLKLENANDPTQSVETDVVAATTGWQTLTFDFTKQATGTAALNPAYTYNKISIFPDFFCGGTQVASAATDYYVGVIDDIGAAAPLAPALAGAYVSQGFNSNNTTVLTGTPGTWGTYAGGQNNPAGGGGGGAFADAGGSAAASYVYQYQNDTLANLAGYTYEGIYLQAPAGTSIPTTGLSSLKFNLNTNGEWATQGTPNVVVLLTTSVAGTSTPTCNPSVAAVFGATGGSTTTAYTVPFSAFTLVTQNCGNAALTAAQVLAGGVVQVDFQADGGAAAITASGLTSNTNQTVAAGTTYPTTIAIVGAVALSQ
jgi:Bacterial Ig-like domain (group 2)